MTQPDGLEGRVSALETAVQDLSARVRRSEQDAAAARVLAGGADRDVAEFGTELREFRTEFREYRDQNNRVLNALREDMVDLREHVDRGFAQVRGRLDATAAGQEQIVRLLDVIIEQQGDA